MVTGFYDNYGRGTLNVDVAIGPHSKQQVERDIGFRYVADVRFPNQYKFENTAHLRAIGIIPAVSIVGPQLA